MGKRATHNLRTGKFPLAPDLSVSKTARNSKLDAQPTQEDHRTKFFEHYRKEADEYDKEFLKKYDEDLNTTLIFVSFVRCWQARADKGTRLVCSLRLPPHLSSTSSLNSSPTRVRRLLPSSESLSTKLTIPPLAPTLLPFPNGLVPPIQLSKSNPSFTRASPLPSSRPSLQCLANSG